MWKALFALVVALLNGCASVGIQPPSIDRQEVAPRSVSQTGLLIGTVVGVTDGDTITLLNDQRSQHSIRLAGIDASERARRSANGAKSTCQRWFSAVACQLKRRKRTDTDELLAR